MRDIIQSERLTLRPLTLEDAKNLSRYGSDYDIARMTGSFPHPFPLLSAEFKVMDLNQKKHRTLAYPYAVTETEPSTPVDAQASAEDQNKAGPMIGIVDLFRKDDQAPIETELEIGYWIGRPFWGKGYATEATRALILEAQRALKITRLKAGVFADNPGSQHVLKKLGFKQDGLASEMFFSMARLEKALSLTLTLDMTEV